MNMVVSAARSRAAASPGCRMCSCADGGGRDWDAVALRGLCGPAWPYARHIRRLGVPYSQLRVDSLDVWKADPLVRAAGCRVAEDHRLAGRRADGDRVCLTSGIAPRWAGAALRGDDGGMLWHVRRGRPVLITTAPESLDVELDRRRRRYAVMAVLFVGSFTAGALLHRDTAVALLLCGIAVVTLVAAVVGANVGSPGRRPTGLGDPVHAGRRLSSASPEHLPGS